MTSDCGTRPEELPLTSILICAYERWDLTSACVASIREHTRAPYEIILVDDLSSEDVARSMDTLIGDDVRVVHNDVRGSFSINNNKAAAMARGDRLCLLNNDTLVTPGWLSGMVRVMEREPDVGVLGNRHLFPETEQLHHCGMAFDRKGHPQHLHPHTDPNAPAVMYQRDVPMVTFACVMIPTAVYQALGGLDEDYRNGYEDCDFCIRATREGHRITYTPASTIYHYGQQSPSRKSGDNENRRLFMQRWEREVPRDFKLISEADRRHTRSVMRRRSALRPAGVHFAVDFTTGSAFSWASVEWALALARRGESVSIPATFGLHRSIDPAKRRELKRLQRRSPCREFQIKWSHYWPQCMNQALAGDVNAEFFCTNYRYRREGRRLDFWSRHVVANDYRKLAIGQFNHDALRDLDIPVSAIEKVFLGYAPEVDQEFPEGLPVRQRDRTHLLLVTNSHDLNRYGTDIALAALARAFTTRDPVTVHIKDYGSGVGSEPLDAMLAQYREFPRVEWHREFVPKSGLIQLYASVDALVAPFRGEGFGMKVMDAMALGLPVLMPRFGGPMEFAPTGSFLEVAYDEEDVGDCADRRDCALGAGAYWCGVQVEDLADKLSAFHADRANYIEMGRQAREHVRALYSWDRAAERLMHALRGWGCERLVTVSARRGPSSKPLSVIIPTKDRVETLDRTLTAYGEQTLPTDQFEIVLVNDHGEQEPLNDVVSRHAALPLRCFENTGAPGPAAARNFAMDQACGEVLLITGDDIIPSSTFLEAHMAAHGRYPGEETAFVGQTQWAPSLAITPFMEYLSGKGGQQFNYRNMKHGQAVPFDRFYTSNVSLKKSLVVELEERFSTAFPFAAYEDIEFAYRLHLQGMRLRYWSTATGFHDHAMDIDGFFQRQYKVGRMLALLAVRQPSFVPPEHTDFLVALDVVSDRLASGDEALPADPDFTTGLPAALQAQGRAILDQLSRTSDPAPPRDVALIQSWLQGGAEGCWAAMNELTLRQGMAETWARDDHERALYRHWVTLLAAPSLYRQAPNTDHIFNAARLPNPSALFPSSQLVLRLATWARGAPVVGGMLERFEQSRLGTAVRQRLLKMVGRL